jgi:hypothetical protein
VQWQVRLLVEDVLRRQPRPLADVVEDPPHRRGLGDEGDDALIGTVGQIDQRREPQSS